MRTRAAVCAVVLLNFAATAVSVWLTLRPDRGLVESELGPVGIDDASGLTWALVGAVLAWLRARNALGWLFLALGTCGTLTVTLSTYAAFGLLVAEPEWPLARWCAWVGSALWLLALVPMANLVPALYPRGRLPGARWRWPVSVAVLGTLLLTAAALLDPAFDDDVAPGAASLLSAPALARVLYWVSAGLLVPATLTIWVWSVVRLVRSRPPERTQLAWLLMVVVPMFSLGFVPGVPEWWWQLELYLVPVAVAVAVFRHNLLGIELVLRRGLVYGALTAAVVAVYLAVTVVAGARLERDPLPGLVAAALVAVALTPLRERLQRSVDRLVYGERNDPLRAVARLGEQVAADEPDLIVAVLRVVSTAVRAPGAVVRGPDGEALATIGSPGPGPAFDLRVGGSIVGSLTVATRTSGDSYGTQDRRLLAVLAPQVAVVVRALDLAGALEAERDRVVTATLAERDRLRRDLHDGLGPSLAGVRLGLTALQDISGGHDVAALDLLGHIRREVDDMVAEVRWIIDGLGPAALDDRGLGEALRAYASSLSSALKVDLAMPDLPPLPPLVAAAAYRIVQEALTNVVRHAAASAAAVGLDVSEGTLSVQVTDNGAGIRPTSTSGVGLDSMRRRAEVLGGSLALASSDLGTTVTAVIPIVRPA